MMYGGKLKNQNRAKINKGTKSKFHNYLSDEDEEFFWV